ncbi:Hypothetical predicted protein [Octopus vulgaris]|uniref:Transmembrane protein n=1 Tax=Octopus vulgaris TaxID=6645 RepID=A0AA36F3Q7_OCTVU|nr:Hypothetical predicted protein [Octopus vulgaris]
MCMYISMCICASEILYQALIFLMASKEGKLIKTNPVFAVLTSSHFKDKKKRRRKQRDGGCGETLQNKPMFLLHFFYFVLFHIVISILILIIPLKLLKMQNNFIKNWKKKEKTV